MRSGTRHDDSAVSSTPFPVPLCLFVTLNLKTHKQNTVPYVECRVFPKNEWLCRGNSCCEDQHQNGGTSDARVSSFCSSVLTQAGVPLLSIHKAGASRPPSFRLKSGDLGFISPAILRGRLSYQPEVSSKKFIHNSSVVASIC